MSLPSYRVEASEEEFIAAPLHRVWQVLRQIECWETVESARSTAQCITADAPTPFLLESKRYSVPY